MLRSSRLLLVPILGAFLADPSIGQVVIRPEPAPGPPANPLKGWCPYVSAGPITLPYSMIFHYASWKELEPTEGRYAPRRRVCRQGENRRGWFVLGPIEVVEAAR